MLKYARQKAVHSWTTLTNEEGVLKTSEVIKDKKKIEDQFPVHVGNAILQYSKLHFLS